MKAKESYFEGSRRILVHTDCGLEQRFIAPDEKNMTGEKTSPVEVKR
jgi:hypothetical protein